MGGEEGKKNVPPVAYVGHLHNVCSSMLGLF